MPQQTPQLLEMIQTLIAIPSVSSVNPEFDQGNLAIIEQLASWLKPLGCEVEILFLPGEITKANLIATWGKGPGGLVLSGHTDTVPYDEGRWTHDPFQLTKVDNRLYGLGTSDMKSFLALAIEAIKSFHGSNFKHPLVLLATADEESTMAGAQLLVDEQRALGRYALIGEPTGLKPVRMHKGVLMESIILHGRSGHSSDPSLGSSALEGMQKVLGEIISWRQQLQADNQNPLFKVPYPTLNLGHIHGGDNPNRICGKCELQIDLRPLPGMELEELRAQLRSRVDKAIDGLELTSELMPLFGGIPAMETDAHAEIVEAAERMTGNPAEAVAFGTEAPYFNQLGMDTVILGPGDIDQAHQPDEYLALDRIEPMVSILKQMIRRFCIE
jgi:acetylornithine deacetylase